MLREEFLNVAHDFRDALLLFQDVGCELRGWQVRDVFLGARIFAVEIAAIGQELRSGHHPRPMSLFADAPLGE